MFDLTDGTDALHRNPKSRFRRARLNSHHVTLAGKFDGVNKLATSHNHDETH
jgi:hypothetical protein